MWIVSSEHCDSWVARELPWENESVVIFLICWANRAVFMSGIHFKYLSRVIPPWPLAMFLEELLKRKSFKYLSGWVVSD